MSQVTNAQTAELERIQSEYLEMPGLKLTAAQASRFWHLGPEDGRALLDQLVLARVLWRTPDGHYVLLSNSTLSNRHGR